jgi:hypothetical protein
MKILCKSAFKNAVTGMLIILVTSIALPADAEIPSCIIKRFPWAFGFPDTNFLPEAVCVVKNSGKSEVQKFASLIDSQLQFQKAFALQGLSQTLSSALQFKIQTEPKANLNTQAKRRAWFNTILGKSSRNIHLDSTAYDQLYADLFEKKPSQYSVALNEWESRNQEDPTDEVLINDIQKVGSDVISTHDRLMKLKQQKQNQSQKNTSVQYHSDPELTRLQAEVKKYRGESAIANQNLADYQQAQLKKLAEHLSHQPLSPGDLWREQVWEDWYANYPSVFTLLNTDAMKNWIEIPMRLDQPAEVSSFDFLNRTVFDESVDPKFKKLTTSEAKKVLNEARLEGTRHYQDQAKKYQDLGIVGNSIWKATPNQINERSIDLAELALRDPENFIRTTLSMPKNYDFTAVCKAFDEAESRIKTKEERRKWIDRTNNALWVIGVGAMLISGYGASVGLASLAQILKQPAVMVAFTVADDVSNMAQMMAFEPERIKLQAELTKMRQRLMDTNDPELIANYRDQSALQKKENAVYSGVSLLPMINDLFLLKNILKSTPLTPVNTTAPVHR